MSLYRNRASYRNFITLAFKQFILNPKKKSIFAKIAVKRIKLRASLDTGKSRRKPSGTTRAWFLERISRRVL
jgi:hypothetical protein